MTPLFEARRSIDRINDQRTSYGVEDKDSLVQQICALTMITYIVRKNWTHMPSTSMSYGRLAGLDVIQVDFEIFKLLYRLNYLNFYFV